jgi:hypothetical protein
MRRFGTRARVRGLALVGALGLVLLSAAPAQALPRLQAQSQPQAQPQPQAVPQARADAGAGLALIRVAGAVELGFALATSRVDSADQNGANSVAESAPVGLSVQGNAPALPGSLVQAAPPDNPTPRTQSFGPPTSPADQLLKVSLAEGSVHARWNEDEALGPCVAPLNRASTSAVNMSAVNVIPALPDVPGLPGLPNSTPTMNEQQLAALRQAAEGLGAPLSQLGGLLTSDSQRSLLRLPGTVHASTEIQLVDVPGQAGKGVQAISRVQFASVRLLAGTPFELEVGVVSQPTLAVTSTGSAATAKVEYTAPVLVVRQQGRELYRLDARNPSFDVPIALVPPGTLPPELTRLPIVGGLLPNGQPAQDLPVIDIGVLRLSVGQLVEQKDGGAVGATARLMDVQLLPTDRLPLPNLPTALAQLTFGEQVARAAAPAGGVVCATAAPAPPKPQPQPRPKPPPLAFTNGAYYTVPLTIIGGAMLLVGTVLVGALPAHARRRNDDDQTANSAVP